MKFQKVTTKTATLEDLLNEYSYINVDHPYWYDWIEDDFNTLMDLIEFSGHCVTFYTEDPERTTIRFHETSHNRFHATIEAKSHYWMNEEITQLTDKLQTNDSMTPFHQEICSRFVLLLHDVKQLNVDNNEIYVVVSRGHRSNCYIDLIECTQEDGSNNDDLSNKLEEMFHNFFQYLCDEYGKLLQSDFDYLTSREAVLETLENNNYFGWEKIED